MRRCRAEQGQAVPLVVGVVAIAALLLLALIPLARAAVDRGEARTAADLAALAGAAEGESAARELAEANGAALVEYRAEGSDVWVVVELGDARAQARARREE
jgi:outer membrane lipoprotein SlyB